MFADWYCWAHLIWEFNTSGVTSWTDLVSWFCDQCEAYRSTALYITQLRTRRQHSLAQNLHHLVVLACPGPATEMSETVAMDAFLDALIETELALRVHDREPTTSDWRAGQRCN